MPIKGNYEWQEKSDKVILSVPLKGVSPKQIDIFCTEEILKINYSPYIIDILLAHKIDSLKHKAVVKNGVLEITLLKQVNQIWGTLEDTEDVIEKRKNSMMQFDEMQKELSSKKKDKQIDEERHALRKQMAIEENERNRIENLKLEEKEKAEKEMYSVFSQIESNNNTKTELNVSTKKKVSFTEDNVVNNIAKIEEIDEDEIDENYGLEDENNSEKVEILDDNVEYISEEQDSDVKYIPPPRNMSNDNKVDIKFTPRIFPTPLRESKVAEEDDWVAKNRKYLKKHGRLGKNIAASKFYSKSSIYHFWNMLNNLLLY